MAARNIYDWNQIRAALRLMQEVFPGFLENVVLIGGGACRPGKQRFSVGQRGHVPSDGTGGESLSAAKRRKRRSPAEPETRNPKHEIRNKSKLAGMGQWTNGKPRRFCASGEELSGGELGCEQVMRFLGK